MIHLEPAGHPDDVSRGFAAVVPHPVIVDRIRMKCVRHGDFKITDFLRAALVHRAGLLFEALAPNPQTCLEARRNFRFARESGKWHPAAPPSSAPPDRRDSSSPTGRLKQPGPRTSSAKTYYGQNR